jgi:hypothetical protein
MACSLRGGEVEHVAAVGVEEQPAVRIKGARQALKVLYTLPSNFRSHMITETGRMVLRAVPLEQRERPAVSEFQEVLTSTTPDLRALNSSA